MAIADSHAIATAMAFAAPPQIHGQRKCGAVVAALPCGHVSQLSACHGHGQPGHFEVTPGNPLSTTNDRKIQVIYWSFKQFGPAALSNEELWFTCSTKRSSEVKRVAGGMSQIMGALLKVFFVSMSMAITGQNLRFISGSVHRLFARFAFFIQDGGAHKVTWHCIGDSGHRFCMLCKNVVSYKSRLADGEGSLRCSVCTVEELDLASNDEIRRACRMIADHKATHGSHRLEARQTKLGFTWHPYNMLLDPELDDVVKPADQFMHEWMHCIFVQGIWNLLLNLVLESIEKQGVNAYAELLGYLSRWHWPHRLRMSKLHELFTPSKRKSNREAGQFKCQASMGLSLCHVIAVWFAKCCGQPCLAVCKRALDAYMALADIVDLMMAVNRHLTTAEQLQTACEAFLTCFAAAFSEEGMTPKFHWLLHFPSRCLLHGLLLACFVHERKHRMLKRCANGVRNTVIFERTVLDEACCHQLYRLDQDSTFNYKLGLLNPHAATRNVRRFVLEMLEIEDDASIEVQASAFSKHNPIAHSAKHDIVLARGDGGELFVGEVLMHVEVQGECLTILCQHTLVDLERQLGIATWQKTGDPILIATSDILEAFVCEYTQTQPSALFSGNCQWPSVSANI